MLGLADLLWGGLLPAFCAVVALWVVCRMTGNTASAWRTAFVLGYVVGHWALDARKVGMEEAILKSFRATEAHDWMPLAVLIAIVPDAVACVGKLGPTAGWVLRFLICVATPWRLLAGSSYLPAATIDLGFDTGAWSTLEATAWLSGSTLFLLAPWLWIRAVKTSESPRTRATLAVLVALVTAGTLAMSGSLLMGQLMGMVAATLAGCAIASSWTRLQRGPEAATGPLVIAFGGILITAFFFAALKLPNAILLMVAMAVAVGWMPRFGALSPWITIVARVAVCLVLLAIPITLAS